MRGPLLALALLVTGCATRHPPEEDPVLAALEVVVPRAESLWSVYGDPRSHGPHQGLDVKARGGARVRAAEPGVVQGTGKHRTAGRWVEVRHGEGHVTRYLHLRRINVTEGQDVRAGKVVGRVGRSGNARKVGPHLHFEVVVDGVAQDPLPYLERLSHIPRRQR